MTWNDSSVTQIQPPAKSASKAFLDTASMSVLKSEHRQHVNTASSNFTTMYKVRIKGNCQSCVVARAYNPRTQEAEA